MTQFDVVTVCFDLELPLLEVQAKSIDRFFPAELLGDIIVVVNEPTVEQEAKTLETIKRDVLPLYGQYQDRVKLAKASDFGELGKDGWLTQQGCKLAVSKVGRSDFYLVLDAKHHSIRPVSEADFFEDGVPIKSFNRIIENQRPWLDASFAYFGAENMITDYRCPTSAPPFMMNRQVCADMVGEIEQKESKDVLRFFADKTDVSTEFTLYIAYLNVKGCYAENFREGQTTYVSFRGKVDEAKIQQVAKRARSPEVWCFSVHRKMFADLGDSSASMIAGVWAQALCESRDEADKWLDSVSSRLSQVASFERERQRLLKERKRRLGLK